ncbi:MAG: peptidoglycan DD-metalloendopeptidase family protein [Candidatus Muirbacterium halophilum]|nr:peptidoglycan DD-metalloendopeptidase family protein [Candidatus Muirbacterium halophilum]MCK9474889.1 peptidoglycan DD-metalloendopeptidase family protein [Candidatus Muirbacterium halophilum]
MQDNNVIKSIDKIINLVIIGILIQFFFIIYTNFLRENYISYKRSYVADSLTMFKSNSNFDEIGHSGKEVLKRKINVLTRTALENDDNSEVLVIKVNSATNNFVQQAQKQLKVSNKKINSEVIDENSPKKERPGIWHRVKKGENLTLIAKLYDISLNDLKVINEISSDIIIEGQKLKISKNEGIEYTVAKGDSLWVIARKFATGIKDIMETNNISNYEIKYGEKLKVYPGEKWFLAKKRENSKPFAWPLDNKITSPYGYRLHPIYGSKLFHSGVDIRGGVGEPIKSAGDGVVTYSGNKSGYGKIVILKHSLGYETRYGHCSKLLVNVGDKVKKGDVIAKVGSTGVSTGPHLHFEVRKLGKTINPLTIK